MALQDLGIVRMLTGRMEWLGQRQRVLAGNVANVNTPGYVARDLQEVDFRELAREHQEKTTTGLKRTSERHLTGAGGNDMARISEKVDPAVVSLSGNAVDLDTELRRVAETGADYQLAADLYRKQMALMRLALGDTTGS